MRIDTAALDKAGRQMEKELDTATGRDLQARPARSSTSTLRHQLGDIFEKLNFEVGRKTKTGKISTSVDVLEELATKYELPQMIIEYRELAKLKNTYVDALPKTDQPAHRTRTYHFESGRVGYREIVSTNPNLQNIPIRSEHGPADSRGFRCFARIRVDVGGLFADRAASVRPHNRRSGDDGSIQKWRRHSRSNRARCFRREDETGRVRVPAGREDSQLRDPVRDRPVRARAAHGADSRGSEEDD